MGVPRNPATVPNPLIAILWNVDSPCRVHLSSRFRLLDDSVSVLENGSVEFPEPTSVRRQRIARKFEGGTVGFVNLPNVVYVLGFGHVQTEAESDRTGHHRQPIRGTECLFAGFLPLLLQLLLTELCKGKSLPGGVFPEIHPAAEPIEIAIARRKLGNAIDQSQGYAERRSVVADHRSVVILEASHRTSVYSDFGCRETSCSGIRSRTPSIRP